MEIIKQKMNQEFPVVFKFLDYKEYLKQYFESKKSTNRNYSYKIFARISGIGSDSLIKQVMTGRRNLTDVNAQKAAEACGLNKKEADYFCSLVAWNQCKDTKVKEKFWNELLKRAPNGEICYLDESHTQIVVKWYLLALLEMVRLKDFRPECNWVSRRFRNKLTVEEIKEGFRILRQLGLLEKKKNKYVLTNKNVAYESEIPSPLIQAYHAKVIPMGAKAVFSPKVGEKEFGSVSMGIRKEDLKKYKELIIEFQERLLEFSGSSEDVDEVYQMNIQFFPLTSGGKNE